VRCLQRDQEGTDRRTVAPRLMPAASAGRRRPSGEGRHQQHGRLLPIHSGVKTQSHEAKPHEAEPHSGTASESCGIAPALLAESSSSSSSLGMGPSVSMCEWSSDSISEVRAELGLTRAMGCDVGTDRGAVDGKVVAQLAREMLATVTTAAAVARRWILCVVVTEAYRTRRASPAPCPSRGIQK
jgi:hypothetical protein